MTVYLEVVGFWSPQYLQRTRRTPHAVAGASAMMALRDFKPEGYVKVGDQFVSRSKLDEIDKKLNGVEMLIVAWGITEASGVREEGGRVLEILGYTSAWEGMEMDKVRISIEVGYLDLGQWGS